MEKAKELKPYFQGRLDIFCAIYAVMNALLLTHGIGLGHARKILHESILQMSCNREQFIKQLNQSIEYHDLVDSILKREIKNRSLLSLAPFASYKIMPKDEVWQAISDWLKLPFRAVIMRFVRPLDTKGDMEIRHWSVGRKITATHIELFDSSLEEGALKKILYKDCLTTPQGNKPGLVYLDPSSIRFLANSSLSPT